MHHITVNWDKQAAADAKNYMQTEGGFSYGSLVQQLEFDKFTPPRPRTARGRSASEARARLGPAPAFGAGSGLKRVGMPDVETDHQS